MSVDQPWVEAATTLAAQLESEAIAVGRSAASRAGREGIAAFLAKRPPVVPGVPGSG